MHFIWGRVSLLGLWFVVQICFASSGSKIIENRALCQVYGHALAVLKASLPSQPFKDLQDYLEFWKGKDLSPEFRAQLTWAEERREFFEELTKHNIYPLDPMGYAGKWVTVTEYLQNMMRMDKGLNFRALS